jgi:hypothetical protein
MDIKVASTDRVNVRRTPKFSNNRVGALNLADKVEVTGPQEGDRWMPCKAIEDGSTLEGFVSKNVLRPLLSEPKERLVTECVQNWLKFDRGTAQENEFPWAGFVGEYWASINMDLDGLDRDVLWSAAFISHAVKNAAGYDGFKFAAAHARYCHKAIRSKLDNVQHPFWGFKINEHKPTIGDMVCRWRSNRIDYQFAANNQWYKSHCDIVVAIEDNNVFTIGGNVRHSVNHTRYKINDQGFLTEAGNVYAVLRNNL